MVSVNPTQTVIILPPARWDGTAFREMWQSRELLFFLTWRDVKVRYTQTVLGLLWAVLQPLLTMIVFTLFLGKFAGLESRTNGVPYPIFVFSGLLLWTFFSTGVNNAANSLVGNSSLVTKVYFPRMIVPIASVGAALVDLAIGMVLLLALLAIYGVAFRLTFLLIPLLFIVAAAFTEAVGVLLASVNVKYRDVRHAVPFLIQIWMFVSCVFYSASLVPVRWRWLLLANPVTVFIETFRYILFPNYPVYFPALAVALIATVIAMLVSALLFRRVERTFADIV